MFLSCWYHLHGLLGTSIQLVSLLSYSLMSTMKSHVYYLHICVLYMLGRICQIANFIKPADFCRIYKISNAVPILLNWHVVRRICQITDFIKSADLCQIYKIGKNICWFYKICSFSAYFIKSSFSTQLIPAEWSCLVTCCRFIQPGKLLHPPPQKKRKAAESDEGTSLKSNEATSPASELTHPAVTRRQVAAEKLKKQANRMILRGGQGYQNQ